MNFSPFGGHFPTSIPTIHQFAAKFSHDTTPGNLCPTQDTGTNRYTANGVPSFTQHHPPPQQQHLLNTSKYQGGTYMNQNTVYSHQTNVRQDKRQGYDQQELAQELYAAMLQQSQQTITSQQHQNKHQQQNNEKVAWQSLATPGSTVADYLSHLPASTLPLSLHHFLKYSAESMKKETTQQQLNVQSTESNLNLLHVNVSNNALTTNGLNTNALNTKCHMAYPEKELLEQHLVGHTLERRFVCDICGAGLKRKDHLTRHKQSHNPERPYVCTVCLKAFKRKEQLTLHFVIHSGEKRHVCTECGKGFYRKDHLRKHTRSHIARRVKAELSQQSSSTTQSLQVQVAAPIPTSSNAATQGIIS
ncbi:hypothetical protein ILUMI_18784 [Ignelater luminosus]|uniref:C2H2-type domain-containing protein n=1 Tax=Ignelater luminosus TaxID=2038154 RepID=A0A8K0CJA1_IGNLU|nr:hypothetical protein ILUMI_18784 [Ignelater luminosus]